MIDLAKMVEGNIQRINDQNIKTVREKPSLLPTVGTCPVCQRKLQGCDVVKDVDGTAPYGATEVLSCRFCDAWLDPDELAAPEPLDFNE